MKTIDQLDEYSRYWLIKALEWADERWNPEFALVQMQFDNRSNESTRPVVYAVRDSVWYATGLLMRQANGDVARALQIIETITTYQFDEPAAVYHGTFSRYPSEPHPRNNTTIWRGYDPNWREFICTVFIIVLKEFDTLLPTQLQEKMHRAIRLAAEGAFERKVEAEYTNISLMSAFLLDFASALLGEPQWRDYALSQAHEIHRLFNRYQTFNEYNSPTYYGVDFYALGLWREYGSNDVYRTLGAEMEAALWRDVAQFYHADMRNICGPYDRSYGMDMTEYIAVVALWIAAAMPSDFAPLPNVNQPFDHAGDYFFVPLVALVGTKPPEDVIPHLQSFQGERFCERIIEPHRAVTAWLSATLMIGAESDKLNSSRTDQFHPATIHWISPDSTIGWIRTRCNKLIQATARPSELLLSCNETTEFVFEIRVTNAGPQMIQSKKWNLPGLTILIERPATPFEVEHDGDRLIIRFDSDAEVHLQCIIE